MRSRSQAIEAEDESMDTLRRKLFTLVLSPNWARGTEAAIDLTLLGRYYPPDGSCRARRSWNRSGGPAVTGGATARLRRHS